jgi:hypothetical protein
LKPGVLGWTVPLVLGVVVGEAIGYVIVVPWDLTWLCLPRNRHAVAVAMFLRLFCVLLALSAWAMARGTAAAGSGAWWRRWAADGGGVVFGLLLILPFAFISNHAVLGHRPYYEVAAESKARLQLGPDYADYRYFARSIDLVFRPGESVLIRASLIAYNMHLSDLQDVAVSWKEPWVGARASQTGAYRWSLFCTNQPAPLRAGEDSGAWQAPPLPEGISARGRARLPSWSGLEAEVTEGCADGGAPRYAVD